MSSDVCAYQEEDLLPLALGQPTSDELQSHVVICRACEQRLQALQSEASTLRQALGGSVTMSRAEEATPATLGKYLLVGKLGQGAQGTAYRALHPTLHKELVIKYARRTVDAGEERNALLREGRILADLDHPHLAKVIDLDIHENRPYLVMEFHRGVNLEQFVQTHKLAPREAAALLVPIARALEAAHRRGVVHQDIKPANILIDETGKPFLVDFGLARLRHAWSGASNEPDGGTVAFMAPEQARNDSAKVGPASDIFSLGAVLYFLLTGQPPFRRGDWYETMQQAGRCEFERAPLHDVPTALASICLRAMSAEPEQRYRRAEDFAADLERYLRRPRRLISAAAAAALVLIAVAAWQFWPTSTTHHPVEVGQPPAQQKVITAIRRTENGKTTRPPLVEGVALKPGDFLDLGFDVPRGFHAAFFLLDVTGNLRELTPLHANTVGPLERVRFPAEGDWRVAEPRGPIVFLACANRSNKPTLDDMRALMHETGVGPLPVPADDYLFLLDRDQLEVPREVVQTPRSRLRDRLERLRGKAADKYDYFWGVALPVR